MGDKSEIKRFENIEDVNQYWGATSANRWLSVIDLSQVGDIRTQPVYTTLYSVACLRLDPAEDAGAHMVFLSPRHYGEISPDGTINIDGWLLCFDPELIRGTLIENRMTEYAFFTDSSIKSLELNASEYRMIESCMLSLRCEQNSPSDKYTKRILSAGIAVLLTQCLRFYERQSPRNHQRNADIVKRIDQLLNAHFSTSATLESLPSVAWCAEQLSITPNYLGDLMRKYGTCSAQEHIQRRIVSEIKIRLERDNSSISQIAYAMGFKYPHHLSRLFLKITGITPHDYRQSHHTRK